MVEDYARRGAEVTGVDISPITPEAIGYLADEMPQHRFIFGDIAAFDSRLRASMW